MVTDAEPFQPARSSDPASAIGPPRGLGGAARCCADSMERSFDMSKSTSVRGGSRRAPPPKSGPRLPLARALLVITRRARIPSRRGCWGCCAGRPGPRSPPSWNPPAGSRTRCGGSLLAWCARSSGSRLPPRRPTAAVSTGSLFERAAAEAGNGRGANRPPQTAASLRPLLAGLRASSAGLRYRPRRLARGVGRLSGMGHRKQFIRAERFVQNAQVAFFCNY